MNANDPFDLERFVAVQRDSYEQALAELQAGRKASHWMWFIFPQFDGLGFSAMSRRYAIRSLDEASAYLNHEVLGARLRECTETINRLEGRTAHAIFGSPDDMKLHSSMTLFNLAAGPGSPFAAALEKYFAGAGDPQTLELVRLR